MRKRLFACEGERRDPSKSILRMSEDDNFVTGGT
jgi:hypothetical protein